MKASYRKYVLDFKTPGGTSRGVMHQKETWFLILRQDGRYGIGECGLLKGLSVDDVESYEDQLKWTCLNIARGKDFLWKKLSAFPSIQFGVEQAFLSLQAQYPFKLFTSDFTEKEQPIPINGLIWMGKEHYMHEQIQQKLKEGFRCIKMKIGAIAFETELALLASIRKKYSKEQIELRVDANGAFEHAEALQKLERLARFDLHSVEQPIRPGNPLEMKVLCEKSPIPIALDEELIGVVDVTEKKELLQTVVPQYIILKPSFVGGYRGSMEWIDLAEERGIGWWVTSALESNIGLNAIAQWTYGLSNPMPQGLGTGGLFTNNFESPLRVENGNLFYGQKAHWQTNLIDKLCI